MPLRYHKMAAEELSFSSRKMAVGDGDGDSDGDGNVDGGGDDDGGDGKEDDEDDDHDGGDANDKPFQLQHVRAGSVA